MKAELLLRFRDFPIPTKQGVLAAIAAGRNRRDEEYTTALSDLSTEAVDWLVEFWSGHIQKEEKDAN